MPCNGSLGDCDCTCLGAREEGEGKAKREGEEQEEEAELWIVSNILEPIQDVRYCHSRVCSSRRPASQGLTHTHTRTP